MFGGSSDQALVARAVRGDAEAWERLILRYESKLYNFALRSLGNREDALDLMQETLLSVFRNLGSFAGRSSFKSWLFTIAGRRAVDVYRRRGRSGEDGSEAGEEVDPGPGPAALTLHHESNRHLMALLDCLSDEQRMVVELKFFQEQTFDEMAKTLGVSANTLKSRFYGALKKMKSMPEVAHAL